MSFCSIYNFVETKAWSRPRLQGEVPIRRRGHTAVSIGTKIYIFGGIVDEGVYMNELIILDTGEFFSFQAAVTAFL